MKPNLLIVDDEEHTREGLELALEDKFEVFLASSAEEAFNAMEAEKFEVVLTDLRMSGESGMSVIDFAIRHVPDAICIMMTAYGEVDVAVEAMKRGAFDFLSKPVNLEKLDLLIMRGLNERKLKKKIMIYTSDLIKHTASTEFWESLRHWRKCSSGFNWWVLPKQRFL